MHIKDQSMWQRDRFKKLTFGCFFSSRSFVLYCPSHEGPLPLHILCCTLGHRAVWFCAFMFFVELKISTLLKPKWIINHDQASWNKILNWQQDKGAAFRLIATGIRASTNESSQACFDILVDSSTLDRRLGRHERTHTLPNRTGPADQLWHLYCCVDRGRGL